LKRFEIGVPATTEHSTSNQPSGDSAKFVAETVQVNNNNNLFFFFFLFLTEKNQIKGKEMGIQFIYINFVLLLL